MILTPEEAKKLERGNWSEAEFTRQVIKLAQSCGWLIAHFRPAQAKSGNWMTAVQGDGKGFPDLVLTREDTVFRELKVGKNKLTADQEKWIARLKASGADATTWHPEEWNEIVDFLA